MLFGLCDLYFYGLQAGMNNKKKFIEFHSKIMIEEVYAKSYNNKPNFTVMEFENKKVVLKSVWKAFESVLKAFLGDKNTNVARPSFLVTSYGGKFDGALTTRAYL